MNSRACREAEAQESGAARLSPTVISLGLVSLLTDIASEMVYTQFPLFLTVQLSAKPQTLGIIEGLAESAASLLRIFSGWLSDRAGKRKPLTVLGYSLGAISKPLMGIAVVWQQALVLRFLDRVGKGLRSAPRDALIAETTPPEMRGRAFGLHRAMDSTGAVLGPLLGIWFLSHVSPDLRHLFLFAGLPGLVAVVTLLLAVREKPMPARSTVATPPRLPRWKDLQPSYRRFLLTVLLFNLGNSSDTFLILRAGALGFKPLELLWLYAAFNLVEVMFGYFAGKLSDRIGRRPLIVTGYVVFAVVYFGFAFAHSKPALCLLFILYGGYYTLTQGVQRAFAADQSVPEQRATQIAAYQTVVGIALLPASVIAGMLFARAPASPFLLSGCTALVSAGLLYGQGRTPGTDARQDP